MHALLNVAVMAARQGGNSLLRSLKRLDKIKVEKKGRNDFVSEADRNAERAVIDTILKHYPDHEILAEESGSQGASDHVWVIDPLDGTTNFLHAFPVFCVSIALLVKGRAEHAAIYDPLRDELFTASRGGGAQLNGRKIRVSGETRMENALLGTGFPYRDANKALAPYMSMFRHAIETCAGVRRPGSAALDLAYVATGRYEGFWETGLAKWDIAAGGLLVREAGGIISGLDGSENYLDTGHVLAGTPKIYGAMAKLFATDIKKMFSTDR